MSAPASFQMDGTFADGSLFSNSAVQVTSMAEPTSALPGSDIELTSESSMKKHAACDECRKRKLKCSGEPAGCTRCVKYAISCVYSPQKQMGRPKKRQRQDESEAQSSSQPYLDPSPADIERTNFENICPGPMGAAPLRQQRNTTSSINDTPPSDQPRTPSDSDLYTIQYPTDYSMWPDFSETQIPAPVQDSYELASTNKSLPIGNDSESNPSTLSSISAIPDCPCLPNLYLTLSTLSTLSAFPISSHTITTLQSAHRTAQSVIYCQICPRKFQTGSQNVMLSNTLITILVDQWARVIKQPALELIKGFSTIPHAPNTPLRTLEELEWKTFAYDLVRAHVFGDRNATPPPTTTPAPNAIPPPQSQIIHLMSLAEAMERRQSQWHGHAAETGEFPPKMTHDYMEGHAAGLTLEDIRRMEKEHADSTKKKDEKDFLCLQLVNHVKRCINQLDRPPPILGDCGMAR